MNPKIEGNVLKNNYETVFDGIFIWIFVVIFVVIFEKIFLVGIAYKQFAILVLFYALLYKSKFQPFSQLSTHLKGTIPNYSKAHRKKGLLNSVPLFNGFSSSVFHISVQISIVLHMRYLQCAYNYVV